MQFQHAKLTLGRRHVHRSQNCGRRFRLKLKQGPESRWFGNYSSSTEGMRARKRPKYNEHRASSADSARHRKKINGLRRGVLHARIPAQSLFSRLVACSRWREIGAANVRNDIVRAGRCRQKLTTSLQKVRHRSVLSPPTRKEKKRKKSGLHPNNQINPPCRCSVPRL